MDEIIVRCARLPLALAILAARAATQCDPPLRELAGELRGAGGCLDAFRVVEPAPDLREVFSWSYRLLSPEAARLFRHLALHPGPDLATAAAASLVGKPAGQVRRTLTELTRRAPDHRAPLGSIHLA